MECVVYMAECISRGPGKMTVIYILVIDYIPTWRVIVEDVFPFMDL